MAKCISGHTIYIYDRGGRTRVGQISDVTRLMWGRERDKMSEATIYIAAANCSGQTATLEAIEPHRTEIVIFRGSERVWEGVVRTATWGPTGVTIVVDDIFVYLMHTFLSVAWDNRHPDITEVSTRIGEIVDYELTHAFAMRDPLGGPDLMVPNWEMITPAANILPHMVIHHFDNEAETSAYTTPYQMTVGQHIVALARSAGIDWTVLGRAFHVWDTSRNIGLLPLMTDKDFDQGVIVSAYGADHTTFAAVATDDGRVGRAGVEDAYYGPWAKVFTVYNEDNTNPPTQSELNSQASRNISGRIPVPVEVRVPDSSTIHLSDTLGINDLVPGVQIPILATLSTRRLSQLQKLDRVKVTETARGEQIQITLTPATKPDEDTEEEP